MSIKIFFFSSSNDITGLKYLENIQYFSTRPLRKEKYTAEFTNNSWIAYKVLEYEV